MFLQAILGTPSFPRVNRNFSAISDNLPAKAGALSCPPMTPNPSVARDHWQVAFAGTLRSSWLAKNRFLKRYCKSLRPSNLLAATVLLLALGCTDADQERAKLAGTWHREIQFESGKACVVLVLELKGEFTERVVVADPPKGTTQTTEYRGQWLKNGSSFTLRYLRENGRQYGGGIVRFQTLQIKQVSKESIVGRDELRSRDVVWRRADGSQCTATSSPPSQPVAPTS
jgi:hypothetical protein